MMTCVVVVAEAGVLSGRWRVVQCRSMSQRAGDLMTHVWRQSATADDVLPQWPCHRAERPTYTWASWRDVDQTPAPVDLVELPSASSAAACRSLHATCWLGSARLAGHESSAGTQQTGTPPQHRPSPASSLWKILHQQQHCQIRAYSPRTISVAHPQHCISKVA